MDRFDLKDYIIDFERIKEITENGYITTIDSEFPKVNYSNVNTELIKKFLKTFDQWFNHAEGSTIVERSKPDARRNNNYLFFVIETLIHNKVLINKRKDKIEKLLNDNG